MCVPISKLDENYIVLYIFLRIWSEGCTLAATLRPRLGYAQGECDAGGLEWGNIHMTSLEELDFADDICP